MGVREHGPTLTIICDDNLRGKLDSNGALACEEEPLHSWVPGSNHELDGQQQQQLSLDPTAIYSNLVCNRSRRFRHRNVIEEM